MTIELAALPWVPPFARGFVRDLRVRWALEEAGQHYDTVFIDRAAQGSPAYRRWQPFGQVPAFRDGAVAMFESGAIILYLAGKFAVLSPGDEAGRMRMTSWVFAALNSVEPYVQDLVGLDVFHAGEAWTTERRPQLQAIVDGRLEQLAAWLGDREWLEDRFTAADLVMVTVLRTLVESGTLARFPTLDAYRALGEARPAFARALEAQLKPFRDNEPPR